MQSHMAEILETLSEEDLLIEDDSQKDVFPNASKFTYLFDISEFIRNTNSPYETVSFSLALKKYQRHLDLLFGRRNAIIVNFLKLPSRRKMPNVSEVIPEEITIMSNDYFAGDIIKTFSAYGHFMIEFNLDVSATIYWLYVLKFVFQIADDFNATKISLINLSLSSLPVEVHEITSIYSFKEEILNVLKGVYEPSFPKLERFMEEVIFYSKDAEKHKLVDHSVAQRIASNYISTINTNHRNAKRSIRLTE